jgi:hypothetical protein
MGTSLIEICNGDITNGVAKKILYAYNYSLYINGSVSNSIRIELSPKSNEASGDWFEIPESPVEYDSTTDMILELGYKFNRIRLTAEESNTVYAQLYGVSSELYGEEETVTGYYLSIGDEEIPVRLGGISKIPLYRNEQLSSISGDLFSARRNRRRKYRVETGMLTVDEFKAIKGVLETVPPFVSVTGELFNNEILTCDITIIDIKDLYLGLVYSITFEMEEVS